MSIVYPSYNRAIVEHDGATLRITIPVARTPFMTAFVVIWLAGWAFSVLSTIPALLRGAPLEGQHFKFLWMTEETEKGQDFIYFMLYWLASGLVIYTVFLGIALWYFAGKEIIELDSTTLKRIRRVPFFRHVREYRVANITKLRLASDMWLPSWMPAQRVSFFTFTGGRIAFDYGRATHHLGLELSDGDTKSIIEAMCKRVRSLCE
jgi:hypothetical protein